MEEQWKQIVMNDMEFDYLISSYGRVYSLKTQKILANRYDKQGYIRVVLRKDGNPYYFLVHRLVAFHFIPNDDETKVEVNHIDENPSNNHVENLEWCTSKYNVNYGGRTERQRNNSKQYYKRIRCVETGEEFESIHEVKRIYGFDVGSLGHCLAGRRKTCGGFHWEYIDNEECLDE